MAMQVVSSVLPFVHSLMLTGLEVYRYYNPDYPATVKNNEDEENDLQNRFRPFLEENGIRNDVRFSVIPHDASPRFPAGAVGGSFSKYASIFVCQNFKEIDEEAFQFCVKHEIGHIKADDCIQKPLVGVIISVAVGIIFPIFIGTSLLASAAVFCLARVISAISLKAFQYYQEGRADDFAIAHSSDEELLGGVRGFKAFQLLDEHEVGNWTHPSNISRIDKISHEAERRGMYYVSTSLDNKKINDLAKLFA